MALAICLQKKGLHPFECFWLSDGKNCHPPFKQLGLSIPNNCQPRYCSKPLHPSRLRRTWQKIMWIIILLALLLSPHECSRYIFCWIAFFVFIAFDYHYKFFIQDYVIILNKISWTSYVLTFLYANIKHWEYTVNLTVNKFCLSIMFFYHHCPSSFLGQQLKASAWQRSEK